MFKKKNDDKFLPDDKFEEALNASKALVATFCFFSDKPNPTVVAGLADELLSKKLNKRQQFLAISAAAHVLANSKTAIKKVNKQLNED